MEFVAKSKIQEICEKYEYKYRNVYSAKNQLDLLMYFKNDFINGDIKYLYERNCHIRVLKNIPITTNICEGFNRSLNGLLKDKHSNLAKLIILLRTQDHIQDKEIDEKICLQNNKKR
ncbi:hypothetical protein DMUE_1341 [Dictyocoela muelleri]|nr:hypothetical protein DMUE_1341 [Dictyocoela muelleri]